MESFATTTVAFMSFAGNDMIALSPLQQFLMEHIDALTQGWWFLWSVVALLVLLRVFQEVARTLQKRGV